MDNRKLDRLSWPQECWCKKGPPSQELFTVYKMQQAIENRSSSSGRPSSSGGADSPAFEGTSAEQVVALTSAADTIGHLLQNHHQVGVHCKVSCGCVLKGLLSPGMTQTISFCCPMLFPDVPFLGAFSHSQAATTLCTVSTLGLCVSLGRCLVCAWALLHFTPWFLPVAGCRAFCRMSGSSVQRATQQWSWARQCVRF